MVIEIFHVIIIIFFILNGHEYPLNKFTWYTYQHMSITNTHLKYVYIIQKKLLIIYFLHIIFACGKTIKKTSVYSTRGYFLNGHCTHHTWSEFYLNSQKPLKSLFFFFSKRNQISTRQKLPQFNESIIIHFTRGTMSCPRIEIIFMMMIWLYIYFSSRKKIISASFFQPCPIYIHIYYITHVYFNASLWAKREQRYFLCKRNSLSCIHAMQCFLHQIILVMAFIFCCGSSKWMMMIMR